MVAVTTAAHELLAVDPASPYFAGMVQLLEDLDREAVGDDAYEPQDPGWHAVSWRTHNGHQRAWAVVEDEQVVAVAKAFLPVRDNTHLVELELGTHPEHRGRGHARALLDRVVATVRDQGRDTVVCGTAVRLDPEATWALHERAVADSGVSTRGLPGPGTSFATAAGAVVAQTELRSQVRLPVDEAVLAAVEAEVGTHADGYTTRAWTGLPPEDLLDDRAVLAARMSTDPPLGDMDWRPEVWDADRVRETYADWQRRGLQVVGAGAVHEASGQMVAFSEIGRDTRLPRIAYQFDTIVVPEHRGRRLGIVVKAANLRALEAAMPDVERVQTWNALENGPMLRVNRAMGFVPVALYPLWQLRLT